MAQAPQAINYQAIARNSAGNPIALTSISVRFRILQGSSTGTAVYAETFPSPAFLTVMTNSVGLFNLAIGRGTVQSGVFANITWGSGTFYLEVAIDPAGGTAYQVVGTAPQMLSVPYALFANRSKSTIICDNDGDTWVETDPGGSDQDQIHMSLGKSPGSITTGTGILGPTVLILRRNNAVGNNTMLELFDPSGGLNTFIGEKAGQNNASTASVGVQNTAVGYNALGNNSIGYYNTAFGTQALRLNINGNSNTGIGTSALQNNDAGNHNTALGYTSLHYTNGNWNTAVGSGALYTNVYNHRSTAIGFRAIFRANNATSPTPGQP